MPHSPFSDVLELRTSAGAFERIEAWLRERGFFAPGGEDLVAHLAAPFAGDPRTVAERLSSVAGEYREPFRGDGWAVVSASPELFLARRGRRVWTMPIKGTLPLDSPEDLSASEKDAAEHVMIVDLERNDLSRVCVPGSVRWPELMIEHTLAGV